MNIIFISLFLLTLIVLIASLVKPGRRKDGTPYRRRDLSIGFGFFAVLFLVLIGITSPNTRQVTNVSTIKVASNTVQPQVKAASITKKTVTATQPIPYTTSTEQDSSLAKGSTEIKTKGVNGLQTQTFSVTYTNGSESSRVLVSTVITTQPVNEVIENGTYVAPVSKVASPAPNSSPAPTPTPSPPPLSCHPLTNGGKCYEPGEYCRNTDHGISGLAGDGEAIICSDNNGWRWEPH